MFLYYIIIGFYFCLFVFFVVDIMAHKYTWMLVNSLYKACNYPEKKNLQVFHKSSPYCNIVFSAMASFLRFPWLKCSYHYYVLNFSSNVFSLLVIYLHWTIPDFNFKLTLNDHILRPTSMTLSPF